MGAMDTQAGFMGVPKNLQQRREFTLPRLVILNPEHAFTLFGGGLKVGNRLW